MTPCSCFLAYYSFYFASSALFSLPTINIFHPPLEPLSPRAEVLANMDDSGSAYTSKDMFRDCSKAGVDYVQVLVAIDARPMIKVSWLVTLAIVFTTSF